MSNLSSGGLSRVLTYLKTWITSLLNSKSDTSHTHSDYIPKAGGAVITGNSIGRDANTGNLDICGGISYENGAFIALRGIDSTVPDQKGVAVIGANSSTAHSEIQLHPDSKIYTSASSISKTSNTSELRLDGGTGWGEGASLVMHGQSDTSYAGSFHLHAYKANVGDISLYGAPDGTLQWGQAAVSLAGHKHTKSEITDFPAYGNTAGTICQGNDSRLSDARTPYFANNTWYAVGDDAAIGDHNVGGGLGVKALNSTTTRIDLCYKDDASNYKSITYDGTTLYMNGNCDYATSAGSCNYANSAGNSDTLDGYHEHSFLRNRGATDASGEGTLWTQIGIKEYFNALPYGLSGVYQWGEVVSLPGTSCRFDIYCSHMSSDGGGLYYRSGWNDDQKGWRCFIDSANIGSQSVNYANSAGSANDPNAVHKSGDETIDGVKTYSSDIYSVSSQHLRFRHLDGSNNGGMDGCLFLNYDNNAKNVYFNGASYYINGGYYNGTAERSNSSGYADSAGSCNYANSAGSASSTSSVSFSNNGQCYINAGGADCADAIDSQACNLAIRSWWSIGFYDQCFNKYAISMDVRNGIVRAYTLRAENSSDKGLQLGSYHLYVG